MEVVIAPDSFKGSLDATSVCKHIAAGLSVAANDLGLDLKIVENPMSDGGEGFMTCITNSANGIIKSETVSDPLRRPISAGYGLIDEGETAVLEMADASGLCLLRESERNPLLTTTFGTGELINRILTNEPRVQKIIIGIGGSATVDGGTGMAEALGFKFYDNEGTLLEMKNGGGLCGLIRKIDGTNVNQRLEKTEILCACDVTNTLVGPNGAAMVYGPQKGAKSSEDIEKLEYGLDNLAGVLESHFSVENIREISGTGAAGGLGAGILAFLNGRLVNGLRLTVNATKLEEKVSRCNLVITGEGRLDRQSLNGKVPIGVAEVAKKFSKPVLCVAGALEGRISEVHKAGVTSYTSILSRLFEESAEAFQQSGTMLELASEQQFRTLVLGMRMTDV